MLGHIIVIITRSIVVLVYNYSTLSNSIQVHLETNTNKLIFISYSLEVIFVSNHIDAVDSESHITITASDVV